MFVRNMSSGSLRDPEDILLQTLNWRRQGIYVLGCEICVLGSLRDPRPAYHHNLEHISLYFMFMFGRNMSFGRLRRPPDILLQT